MHKRLDGWLALIAIVLMLMASSYKVGSSRRGGESRDAFLAFFCSHHRPAVVVGGQSFVCTPAAH
jgi:hypothetical protein